MFRSSTEIDSALERLGRRLLYADSPAVAIVVCGGSALQMLGLSSRIQRETSTIPAAAPSLGGPFPERGARLPDVFMAAADAVARDLGLSPDWLNTAAEEVNSMCTECQAGSCSGS